MRLIFPACAVALFSCSALTAQENAPHPLPAPAAAPVPSPESNTVTKKEAGDVNAMLTAARAATAKKQYSDSEDLMLKATRQNPNMVLPWVELGLAQLGLEKYNDAENDFKVALGIDPITVARTHDEDFYQKADAQGVVAPSATRASRNTVGGVVDNSSKRTPDVLGTSYASLGEIYMRQKKFAEAKQAFDQAVKAYPTAAPSYRHNEAIFFFRAGNSDEQLAAADQAIALDPNRADMYYFKAQALVSKATIDSKTQKMVLPPGCAEAYQKYLKLDPNGPYSADAKSVLAAVK